jgi:hypothetical protein
MTDPYQTVDSPTRKSGPSAADTPTPAYLGLSSTDRLLNKGIELSREPVRSLATATHTAVFRRRP